ncbi:MAG: glucose-1-phosphate adenylyltransferase [Clostridiales bacterium]|nr:glucose-1-phosphate adenylyltransferase [Clostridiales bacterium]
MYRKKECVAMLLAGGQGSRLYTLTETMAKPAVQFGGKYRIIDFPLSNCVNSGIDTVGVLTQYQPLVLNEYIGNGEPWDLDKSSGGVHVLPPYQGKKGSDWYKGTANAIYQNINFIKRYSPKVVLILSGDHIYKMNYSKMIREHIRNNADCTIAVLTVPMDQAKRFGILNTDKNNKILDFEEKPANPKSNKASMGIYVFSTDVLINYLVMDEQDKESSNDFGKNIIPKMLADGKKMYAYDFEGYWKDVGTISSLWESNMDLLGKNPAFNLFDKSWRIYYRHEQEPPQRINAGADVQNSFVTEGCNISGKVYNSVLSNGVIVEKGAMVKDSVIMSGVVVKSGAVVDFAIIDHDTVIDKDAEIGDGKDNNKSPIVLGADLVIPKKTKITGNIIVDHDNFNEVIGKGENK